MTLKPLEPKIFNKLSTDMQISLLLAKLNQAINIIKNIQDVTNQNTGDIAKLETRMDADID